MRKVEYEKVSWQDGQLATNNQRLPLNVITDDPVMEGVNFTLLGHDVQPGACVVLGAAGTGKSTFMAQLEQTGFGDAPVFSLHVNEPDYTDALTPGEFPPAFVKSLGELKAGSVLLIDSLRHFATIGTPYSSRLAASGFDLTLFQAASDLDRAAKRLNVLIVAVVFLNTYQLTKGDLTDRLGLASLMRTVAFDMDGSTSATILFDDPDQPGSYRMTSRSARGELWTGRTDIATTQQAPIAVPITPQPWMLASELPREHPAVPVMAPKQGALIHADTSLEHQGPAQPGPVSISQLRAWSDDQAE